MLVQISSLEGITALCVVHQQSLPQSLVRSNISMYADDTVIYTTGSRPDDVMMKIQEDIQRVEQWMKSNQLVLNLTKTFRTALSHSAKTCRCDGFQDPHPRKRNWPGQQVLLSWGNLRRKPLMERTCRWGVQQNEQALGFTRPHTIVFNDSSSEVYLQLSDSTGFEFTDTAWGELSVECSNRLLRLQNRAVRITIRSDRSSDAIKNLGWEKLETIRKRNKATLVFKCLNNLAPACFKNYFTRTSSYHFYNTRQKQDLHIPKAKLSKGKKTFRFSGATLFNRLPDSLKQAKSLQIFKRNIGQYSF